MDIRTASCPRAAVRLPASNASAAPAHPARHSGRFRIQPLTFRVLFIALRTSSLSPLDFRLPTSNFQLPTSNFSLPPPTFPDNPPFVKQKPENLTGRGASASGW